MNPSRTARQLRLMITKQELTRSILFGEKTKSLAVSFNHLKLSHNRVKIRTSKRSLSSLLQLDRLLWLTTRKVIMWWAPCRVTMKFRWIDRLLNLMTKRPWFRRFRQVMDSISSQTKRVELVWSTTRTRRSIPASSPNKWNSSSFLIKKLLRSIQMQGLKWLMKARRISCLLWLKMSTRRVCLKESKKCKVGYIRSSVRIISTFLLPRNTWIPSLVQRTRRPAAATWHISRIVSQLSLWWWTALSSTRTSRIMTTATIPSWRCRNRACLTRSIMLKILIRMMASGWRCLVASCNKLQMNLDLTKLTNIMILTNNKRPNKPRFHLKTTVSWLSAMYRPKITKNRCNSPPILPRRHRLRLISWANENPVRRAKSLTRVQMNT